MEGRDDYRLVYYSESLKRVLIEMSSTAFSCGQSAHQLHHGYIYFTDGGVSAKSMLTAVTKLARKGPIGAQGKAGWTKENVDDITAQLHKAEQNLQVERSARKQAERQADKHRSDAKAAGKWAAALDEESALLHKQQVLLAHDLQAANLELEQLRAGVADQGLPASPTPSEQLVQDVRDAKISWTQSQDCMRVMASSAAAAEARARQLQAQLTAVEEDLRSARSTIADLGAANKAREVEVAASAGQICSLQQRLQEALALTEEERRQVTVLKQQLQRWTAEGQVAGASVAALEGQQGEGTPLGEPLGGGALMRALSEGDAGMLEGLAKAQPGYGSKTILSVSLPSLTQQPSGAAASDLEASICNLSSPAALTNPLQRAALKNWMASSPLDLQGGTAWDCHCCSQASDQENQSPAELGQRQPLQGGTAGQQPDRPAPHNPFRLTPERQQPAMAAPVERPGAVAEAQSPRSGPSVSLSRSGSTGGLSEQLARMQEARRAVSDQAALILQEEFQLGFREEENQVEASDFGPLGRGQAQLQDVVQGVGSLADGSLGREPRERQPLSPANRDTSQRTPQPPTRKSPFGKSSPLRPPPAKPEARPCEEPGDSLSNIPVFSFKEHENELTGPQEVPGPLGMGSRGVDNHSTPQKERGAHAVHKGLLKFAHKVSPMRMAGRGGRSPYHSPSKGF